MKFEGKTVVVTGAASGIGRATALRFAAEGANVFTADINVEGGQSLVEESGGKIKFQRCDVTDVADIKKVMDSVAEASGGIDVLYNNAGAPGALGPIDQIEPEQWDFTLALVLRSVAMGIRYAAPHMKGRPGAAIVNTASTAGHRVGMGNTVYGVAKAGIHHLTRMAAADLARYGIRVNSVSPGLINTNIFANVLKLPKDQFEQVKAKFEEASVNAQPLAHAGQPEDIAGAVLFLASADASFVTGADLVVDGGIILGDRRAWDPDFVDPLQQVVKNAINSAQ